MFDDPYGNDVLAGNWKARGQQHIPEIVVDDGLIIEWAADGWTGLVIDYDAQTVTLEDRHGRTRNFPFGAGYLLEGEPVRLVRHASGRRRSTTSHTDVAAGDPKRRTTASGSRSVAQRRARTAIGSRIYVEGRHDAELVEKVWGDDLRLEGVVVEYMGGVDDLAGIVREFRPEPTRRLGVLVDHLVPGTKESHIVERARRAAGGEHLLVVGHPFIDIWQAVKPQKLGMNSWPTIPRNIEWKRGICEVLGWPSRTQTDIANAWQHILSRVHTYTDLEPAMLGRMEELIDFVTAPDL